MSLNRVILFATLLFCLVATAGCHGRRRRKVRHRDPVVEDHAEPVVEDHAEPIVEGHAGLASDPCDSQDRPHHWIFYPDEPLYFCDTHRHHWIPDGAGSWAHIHEYDQGRPNYAAPILSNESEFDIYLSYDAHAAAYPPGTRRR